MPFKIRDSALCLEALIVKVKMVEYKTHLITDICLPLLLLSSWGFSFIKSYGQKPGQSMPKWLLSVAVVKSIIMAKWRLAQAPIILSIMFSAPLMTTNTGSRLQDTWCCFLLQLFHPLPIRWFFSSKNSNFQIPFPKVNKLSFFRQNATAELRIEISRVFEQKQWSTKTEGFFWRSVSQFR